MCTDVRSGNGAHHTLSDRTPTHQYTCTPPEFIAKADEVKAKGVDAIYCIASNDAFVVRAWGLLRAAGLGLLVWAQSLVLSILNAHNATTTINTSKPHYRRTPGRSVSI